MRIATKSIFSKNGKDLLVAAAFMLLLIGSTHVQAKIMDGDPYVVQEAFSNSYTFEYQLDYQSAIAALDDIYKKDKGNYTVNLRLGWLHYMNGAYTTSATHYQTAMKAVPTSVEAKAGYMLPLLAQEKYEDAESVAYQALKLDNNNYYASLRLVYALRLQGKYKTAEDLAIEMLDLYPTDVYFLSELGLIYEYRGEHEAALDVFMEVLTLDPDNATALLCVGN